MARDFAVPVLGLLQPPAVLGDTAELVVAGRHAGPVAEVFFDGQGFAVPVFGLLQPPPVLGDHAEVVVDAAMWDCCWREGGCAWSMSRIWR